MWDVDEVENVELDEQSEGSASITFLSVSCFRVAAWTDGTANEVLLLQPHADS